MASKRKIRAGNTITLRARFKDDIGDEAQASGVVVHIFQPGHAINNLANALVVSGQATYFDKGLHEYQFTVPGCGPNGEWTDVWYGTLNCQTLSGIFNFQVSASGNLTAIGEQLNKNNLIEVTIPSGILSTDGVALESKKTFSFLTTLSPTYTNTRKVRLEVGSWVTDLYDDTIQLGILEASLEADEIAFGAVKNKSLFEHARREWTTCKTGMLLLSNLGQSSLRAKSLDNLRVEYDPRSMQLAIERLMDCMNRWEPQILAGGASRGASQPKYVVKGELDFDRPAIGRLWYDTGVAGDNAPAANTKLADSRSRRVAKAFIKRKKWW